MGSAIFGHRGELTPDIIARRIEAEAWLVSPWAGLVEDIFVSEDDIRHGTVPEPKTQNPIVKYTSEFYAEGSDTLLTTMLRRLTGAAIPGDQSYIGSEANQVVYRHGIHVNEIGKGVNTSIGEMNDLRQRRLKMAEQAEPQLKRWLSEYMTAKMITIAFYEGYNYDVTLAAASLGLGKTKLHHPNWWIENKGGTPGTDDSWITWNATAATYTSAIYTALTALAAENENRAFNSVLLDRLRPALPKKRIRPYGGKANPFYKIYLHPDQFKQAGNDTKILTATDAAWNSHRMDHPMIKGGSLYYRGFVLEENILVGQELAYDTPAADELFFGPCSGTANAGGDVARLDPLTYLEGIMTTKTPLRTALLVGPNSLSFGSAKRARMIILDDARADADQKKSVYIRLIAGAARRDFVDNFATPTAVYNDSSAVIVTYSP